MRDSRFPAGSTVQNDLIAQGRLVEDEIWLSSLVDHLYLALRESRRFENGEEFFALSLSLSDQLIVLHSKGTAIPGHIAIALDRSFESQAEDAIAAQAAWCWGLALGRRALEVKAARDLRSLLDKASHDFVMLEAFLGHIARSLFEHHPAVQAAVDESLHELIKDPGCFILGGRGEAFLEALNLWKKKPPYEAFDLRMLDSVPLHYEFLGLIEQLKKIDSQVYFAWLDRLQNPVLIKHAFLNPEIMEDFDELLILLEVAPTAYDDEQHDGWVSLIAPLLLEAALYHAQSLLALFAKPEHDEEAYKQLCKDLCGRMQRLAQGLARRNDGSRLVAHWLMRLVRIKTQLNAWLSLPASMAIRALVQVFGDSEVNAAGVIQCLPPTTTLSPDDEKHLRLSGVGQAHTSLTPGIDILIVKLLMKAFRQDTKSFEDELRAFNNLLLVRDSGLFTDPSLTELATWRHQLVGRALTGPNLVGTWKSCWDLLEEQRRRTRHAAFTLDHSADEPSLFLCSTALSLLEEEGDSLRVNAPDGLALWNIVYESVWLMVLLYGSQAEGEVWRYLLALLMRALPKHLEIASDHGTKRLSDLLASFAGDDELVTHSVARLFRAGSSSHLLTTVLNRAGLKLESILDRLEHFSGDRTLYPMMRRWPDAMSTCRQILKSAI